MYSGVLSEVKEPGAEYTSCAIYFWAVLGIKSRWRNSIILRPQTLEIFTVSKVSGRNLQGLGGRKLSYANCSGENILKPVLERIYI